MLRLRWRARLVIEVRYSPFSEGFGIIEGVIIEGRMHVFLYKEPDPGPPSNLGTGPTYQEVNQATWFSSPGFRGV
jgi:hypothetical protein